MSFWQRYAGAIAFLAVLAAGVVMYIVASNQVGGATESANQAKASAASAKQFASQGFSVVLDTARINCRQDRKFRVQYKRRGEAVVVLLQLLTQQERRASKGSERAALALKKLRPLTGDIHIIPIPSCHDQISTLRKKLTLAESGSRPGE